MNEPAERLLQAVTNFHRTGIWSETVRASDLLQEALVVAREAPVAALRAIVEEWDATGGDTESLAPHIAAARAITLLGGGEQPAPLDVDELAQIIREVDGSHSLGAGALAEAIVDRLSAQPSTEPAQGGSDERADAEVR